MSDKKRGADSLHWQFGGRVEWRYSGAFAIRYESGYIVYESPTDFFSVQALCGCFSEQFINHRDTEDTEVAQRRQVYMTLEATAR